jgi:uncharacterized protein (DUF169 family)
MYFQAFEFNCKCGACRMGLADMDIEFVDHLLYVWSS